MATGSLSLPATSDGCGIRTREDESIDWRLPGHSEPYTSCGVWVTYIHDSGSRSHWRKAKVSCHRAVCRTCYEDWAGREAERIERRVHAGCDRSSRRPVHWVVAPPSTEWERIHKLRSYRTLRSAAYAQAARVGWRGGVAVFHHLRVKSDRDWAGEPTGFTCTRPGPHWHFIGDGWHRRAPRPLNAGEWVVRNLRVRKSVRSTAHYLLSHAGIPRQGILAVSQPTPRRAPVETVTWVGSMAYNRLATPPDPAGDGIPCPVCHESVGAKWWYAAEWVGQGPPPTAQWGDSSHDDWRQRSP